MLEEEISLYTMFNCSYAFKHVESIWAPSDSEVKEESEMLLENSWTGYQPNIYPIPFVRCVNVRLYFLAVPVNPK